MKEDSSFGITVHQHCLAFLHVPVFMPGPLSGLLESHTPLSDGRFRLQTYTGHWAELTGNHKAVRGKRGTAAGH